MSWIVKSGANHGLGTAAPTAFLDVNGDLRVDGNLDVTGTTTTVDSETVLVSDNHMYLNNGYTADAAQTGGLVVNIDPDGTATEALAAGGFVAGVASTSNPTAEVASTAGFAASDIIQVSGSTSNDGLYEVLSLLTTPPRLEIRGVGVTGTVEDFTQNQFVAEAGAGQIDKVKVAVIRAGTDGLWEQANGSSTPLSFTNLGDVFKTGSPADNQIAVFTDGVTIEGNANLTWGSGILGVVGQLDVDGIVNLDLSDNTDNIFLVRESTNNYLKIATTNGSEVLEIGNAVTNPLVRLLGSGNLQIDGGDLDFNGANIDLDPTGNFTLTMDSAQLIGITAGDNHASAFSIDTSALGEVFKINTVNSSEEIQIGSGSVDMAITQLGDGVVTLNGTIVHSPPVATSGAPTLFSTVAAAYSGLTASTEVTDVNIDLSRTMAWATGNITDQRSVRIQAPTFFDFAGASVVTNAYTMSIEGAPVAGTNATINNRKALLVQGGAKFEPLSNDGDVIFDGMTVSNLLVVEAGLNRVGVGTALPGGMLGVVPAGSESGLIVYNSSTQQILNVGGLIAGNLLEIWTPVTTTVEVLDDGGMVVSNTTSANDILELKDSGQTRVRFPDGMDAPLAGMQLHSTTNDGALNWGQPSGDPTRVVSEYDDFLFGAAWKWNITTSGTGAVVQENVTANNHPGAIGLNKGTTSAGIAAVDSNNGALVAGDCIVFEASVNVFALADPTDDFQFRIGIADQVGTGIPTNGIYIQYDRFSSHAWKLNTRSGGVGGSHIGSAVAATNTWHRLKFVLDRNTGDVTYYVDGVSQGTLSTNIPPTTSTTMSLMAEIDASAGSNQRFVYIDYIAYTGYFGSDR